MKIRAKFRCVEKINRAGYAPSNKPTCHVKLTAVVDDANKMWAQYTPAGTIDMQIDNPTAYDAFVLGECYFIDFTPVTVDEAVSQAA